MEPVSLRIVARETATRDEVDDAMRALGCRLINVVPATAGVPHQLVFASERGGATVHFVRDEQIGALVFVLGGPQRVVARLTEQLRSAIATYRDDEIEQLAARSDEPSAMLRGLQLTALTAQPSELRVARFSAALSHDDEAVRGSALDAAIYAAWPTLAPHVARLAERDPSAKLRTRASEVLSRWSRP